jgi:hypothetical protein
LAPRSPLILPPLVPRLRDAFDQTAIAGEALHRLEAVDVIDLIKKRQRQRLSDAGNGFEEGEVATGDPAGGAYELAFQIQDHAVVVADGGQVGLQSHPMVGIGIPFDQPSLPRIAVATAASDGVVALGHLHGADAHEQFGATPDVGEALAQEGANGPFVRGVDVGIGNEIAGQEAGEFFGVDPVVLVLAAMDGPDVKGMGQDEWDVFAGTGIGQPVPAEEALAGDGEVVTEGFDLPEEEFEVVVLDVLMKDDVPLGIDDADVHGVGVQINSAVEGSGSLMESHLSSISL